MPVVSFDVRGAGKVVDANAKINAAIKKGHRDLVKNLVKGNRALLADEGKSAAEKLKISKNTFRLIRGSERQAARERKKELDQTTAAQKAAGRVVERVAKANETSQERLNRKIRETKKAFKDASASPELLGKEIRRLKKDYKKAQDGRDQAFGANAISQLKSYALGFVSVGAAIRLVTGELQFHAAERERISQNAKQARFGLGELAQLAVTEGKTPAEREAAHKRNLAEARAAFGSGAFLNVNEAGGTIFQLKSAGLSREDRDFAIDIRRGGALKNVGGTGKAFAALVSTLGKDKIGSFADLLDRAIQASEIAPALASEIPLQAARSGGSARALGIDIEFILAATARLAKARGSAEGGGTDLASFLKQLEKAVADPKVKENFPEFVGKRGEELIDAFLALPEEARGFGGVLGDRAQAVQGGRTIGLNRELLRADVAAIRQADRDNIATALAILPLVDASQAASVLRQQEENKREVSRLGLASFEDLAQTSLLRRRKRREADGFGVFDLIAQTIDEMNAYIIPRSIVFDEKFRSESADFIPIIKELLEDEKKAAAGGSNKEIVEETKKTNEKLDSLNQTMEDIRDSGGLTGVAG